MKKTGLIIRIIIAVLSLCCLVWACDFFSAGAVIGVLLFGSVFAVCAAWRPFCNLIKRLWDRVFGRIALIFFGTLIGACAVLCVVFSVNMAVYVEEPVSEVKAVMVLGCRVKGEEPSNMLKSRLNAALEVLGENPEAVCVVSGGKGSGEDISEAEAMGRYLAEHGISEERIFKENTSVSTRENFRFSKGIFEELGISDGIVIATNDFHQFRAELYAKQAGLDVGHHSAKTPLVSALNYWIREWAALAQLIVYDFLSV